MKFTDHSPETGIVFFDGYCVLCNRAVALLIRLDWKKRLFFATFDSNAWKEIAESKPLKADSIVYYINGKQYLQSEAILHIIHTLEYPWRLAYIFKFIPYSIREKFYMLIARNRYSIFGRRKTCKAHSTVLKSRYLT